MSVTKKKKIKRGLKKILPLRLIMTMMTADHNLRPQTKIPVQMILLINLKLIKVHFIVMNPIQDQDATIIVEMRIKIIT